MKPTTSTALAIVTKEARHAARIAAAHSRHAVTLPDVITLRAYTDSNAAEVTKAAHIAAFLTLRAREQGSGLDIMRRLAQQQSNDRKREELPRIAGEALEARAAHDQHRSNAATLQAIADRISTPADQAHEAAAAAATERRAAAQALAHAERLERVIFTTSHSDRADISQAAAVELWNTGNFAAACKAAGKAIAAVAAAQGCTATRTKVQPITAAEAAQEQAAHPNAERIPFNVQGGNSTTAGFYTIEYRNSARFPAGWYRVNHYHTTAPYMSYEVFSSSEAAAALQTNGGINAITNQQAAEDIAALFDRAKLSDRERIICRYMLDNTAAVAGVKAVEEHQRKTAEAKAAATSRKRALEIQHRADERTEEIRAAAIRHNAMSRAAIYSERTQRDIMKRIREKLEAAKSAPQEQPTAAELDCRMWKFMQSNRSRYSRSRAGNVQPLEVVPEVKAYCNDHNAKPTEYAAYNVELVETVNPADLRTVTAAELEAEAQAAQAARAAHSAAHAADIMRTDYRRAFTQGRPSRSAYAALDAQAAALVFFEAMSRAEQFLTIAAAKAEEAAEAHQRAAAALAKAEDKHEVHKHTSRAAELEALAAKAPKHRREELKEAAERARAAAERASRHAYHAAAELIKAAEAIAADVSTLRVAAEKER